MEFAKEKYNPDKTKSPNNMVRTSSYLAIAIDTLKGLTSSPKHLKSKYFYDAKGSEIFQKIMRMPEYYLTNCEHEIIRSQAKDIISSFTMDNKNISLVELGVGDGLKTKSLLKELRDLKTLFKYYPIDISEIALIKLVDEFKCLYPGINIEGKAGDYFEMLEEINYDTINQKVLLFLGSSIGNFTNEESTLFFKNLRSLLFQNDLLFIGFDLKKHPKKILDAYSDPHGITRRFNLNLLSRLNNELGAEFALDKFEHYESYDPITGTAKSYLISLAEQSVYIEELDTSFSFKKWEPIYVEVSQKYDIEMIEAFAKSTGFKIQKNFFDKGNNFVNSLWRAI